MSNHILVVANVTATSDELLAALEARAAKEPAEFTLIVPATPLEGGRAGASERLHAAIARLRAAGLEVEGHVADGNPIAAVTEAWDPGRYDEIILSTLAMRVSKWLHAGLPQRISELTGALVTHVVARPCPTDQDQARAPAAAVQEHHRTAGRSGLGRPPRSVCQGAPGTRPLSRIRARSGARARTGSTFRRSPASVARHRVHRRLAEPAQGRRTAAERQRLLVAEQDGHECATAVAEDADPVIRDRAVRIPWILMPAGPADEIFEDSGERVSGAEFRRVAYVGDEPPWVRWAYSVLLGMERWSRSCGQDRREPGARPMSCRTTAVSPPLAQDETIRASRAPHLGLVGSAMGWRSLGRARLSSSP